MSTARAVVKVPATIGNVGPGFDVLGLCLDGLCDVMSAEWSPNGVFQVEGRGREAERLPSDTAQNCAVIAAQAYLRARSDERALQMIIDRSIPMAGGLGSSAAASLGGALLAAACRGDRFDEQAILAAALAGEGAVAGRHLDNIAPCLYGGLTICLDVTGLRVERIDPAKDWWIALVTPAQDLQTKEARAVLPEHLQTSAWTRQMALTSCLVVAFAKGDESLARQSLRDEFAERYRAPLIKNFSEAKAAALRAGAIGCSISGGGPTVFALCADEQSAKHAAAEMVRAFSSAPRFCATLPIRRQGAESPWLAN